MLKSCPASEWKLTHVLLQLRDSSREEGNLYHFKRQWKEFFRNLSAIRKMQETMEAWNQLDIEHS